MSDKSPQSPTEAQDQIWKGHISVKMRYMNGGMTYVLQELQEDHADTPFSHLCASHNKLEYLPSLYPCPWKTGRMNISMGRTLFNGTFPRQYISNSPYQSDTKSYLTSHLVQPRVMPQFFLTDSTRSINLVAKNWERNLDKLLDRKQSVNLNL